MSHLPQKPSTPVLNRHDQGGWNTNRNYMKNTHPFHILFHVLKVFLIKFIRYEAPVHSFLV